MWIDAHAHCSDFSAEQLKKIIDSAGTAGITHILNTATNLTDGKTVLRQCEQYPQLFAAVGISPFDVEGLPADWESQLIDLCKHPDVIGLGETGLDATNPRYPALGLQESILAAHLQVAKEHDLPAILHTRGAEQRAIDLCKEIGVDKVMLHCFTGDIPAMRSAIDAGYYLSISGIVTFRNSPLPPLVQQAPLDRLLIETDTPYLAPVPYRGKQNQPAWVADTGKAVATLKGITPGECARTLRDNFSTLFGMHL
ncbi:MAG: YchF/TatD family DNA exonuclease [Chitinivibrionales bacterium]|nr:YchF/TatD family DNA exonuclease [Chitinivibrionales bacterium]